MSYILFIDDERTPSMVDQTSWPTMQEVGGVVVIARSTEAAKEAVGKLGMPRHFSFDHDLGGEDTTMRFLKWLTYEFCDVTNVGESFPTYNVHSANPVGKANIECWMDSWKRSLV